MANHLGVTFVEKDQSQTQAALAEGAGAIGIYSIKGRTDKAVRAEQEVDIKRNFTQPHAKMTVASGIDYGRGLQNAFQFVRAGLPMYIKRAIPTATPPAPATADLQSDGAVTPKKIQATCLGHGVWYNTHLRAVITGIEYVSRKVTIGVAKVTLDDNVLPRSLVITKSLNTGVDTAFAAGGASTAITLGTSTVTVTYEDTTGTFGGKTTLLSTAADGEVTITYQRTTVDKVVRLYLVDADELAKGADANPTTNYLETFLVSYKAEGKDELGNSIFIEDVIRDKSEYISVLTQSGYSEDALAVATKADFTDAIAFANGTDGVYAASDADMVTAYGEFYKKDYDIVYIFDAAYLDDVKKRIAAVCKARLWPHGYIDPPADKNGISGNKLTVITNLTGAANDIVAWRMGLGMGLEAEFVSLTGNAWGSITDTFNGGRLLWMPPSYNVCYDAIQVDSTLGPWKTTAGPRRGITGFQKLSCNLYDYRDQMNVKQVNPLIIDERGVQMFYGNKTMKMTKSAMQNTHARKTRSRMSREFYFTALDFIMEDIDTSTINDLTAAFENIIASYADALDSYTLVVGPPKTTDADIANQILRIGVGLIFKEIAEEIEITTTVYRIGTDLSVVVV